MSTGNIPDIGHVYSPDSTAGQHRPFCCPTTGVTCNRDPYWPHRADSASVSDGSAALFCSDSQPTCAGNLEFRRNASDQVAGAGPLAGVDSYNDCRCSPNTTYPTDTTACTHFELISTSMCEFTSGARHVCTSATQLACSIFDQRR